MICLYEQYGYGENKFYDDLSDDQLNTLSFIKESRFSKYVPRKNEKENVLVIDFDKNEEKYHFQTSYFVGVDWVVENKLSIYIQPKLNKETSEIDCLGMLLEALQEPENLKHLDDLVHIDFHKPYIAITQQQDLLSPFLIAQFLQVLKRIVRKGLKKSYYSVTENLNARVKGKVLAARNIKENLVRGKQIHTICRFQEFGVNSDENKILKKAYQFSRRVIQQYDKGFNTQPLLQLINYIHPAFENVSEEIDIRTIKTFRSNPLFKEYDQAISLALLILKRYSYNITQTQQQKVLTPPFWIDMSKLFELYVYKKLRAVFKKSEEVEYHPTIYSKEIDFLINSLDKGVQMVVDTKYKPRYYNTSVDLDDYRQICGYARLQYVYDKFNIESTQIIDCLIIYPNQNEYFLDIDLDRKVSLPSYVRFYKLGIKLPEKNN